MRKFLVWINLLPVAIHISAQDVMPSEIPFHFDNTGKIEYNFFLQFKENGFTGICIIKQGDGEMIGSIINEFGVKAFDFVYKINSGKIRLLNVIAFMDKWYIKKIVMEDWKYLLAYPNVKKQSKKRKVVRMDDGGIVLENTRHRIRYTLTPF
ncbi:MAG: hypothetical protein LBU44_03950 [Mediterranea sp.]|jgi:hypothetical protein|nr:hypothetical protein [Mediterranea sp.]